MELTVDQALQQAAESQASGRLGDAEKLYRAILEAVPEHPQANRGLGLLAVGVGKPLEGLAFLKAAVEAEPADHQNWVGYVQALLAADRPHDARAAFEQLMRQGASGEAMVFLHTAVVDKLQREGGYAPYCLPDVDDRVFYTLLNSAWPHSMWRAFGGVEVFYSLYQMINYVLDNNIPGDFVECGVNAGGMSFFMAICLMHRNDNSRRIFLYDTFEGMPAPSEEDGQSASTTFRSATDGGRAWAKVGLEDVQQLMATSGYPQDKIVFAKGLVEDTIPSVAPSDISILRLDTDFYSSTKHELDHLYPRLSSGGCLIVDDYGYWQGARIAVDEYFARAGHSPLLNRVNFTVRVGIKT